VGRPRGRIVIRWPRRLQETMESLPAPPSYVQALFPYACRSVAVSGGQLAYVASGTGRPVVLVHGNPTWGFLFRKVMADLTGAPLRLLAPDLLGFGRSSKPRSLAFHSVEAHGRTLLEWMAALDVQDAVLVVQDWGGPFGLWAAAHSGARVSALCLLNTAVVLPARFKGTTFHRLARLPVLGDVLFRLLGFPLHSLGRAQADPQSISKDVARAYRWPFRHLRDRAGPLALARLVPDGPSHPSVHALREVEAFVKGFVGPVELVWGTKDPILGRALKRHRAALPRARVTEVDAGHFLQEEAPQAIARAIRRLARIG
jgi:cis-3-alkyl-4-acyloxetan-2-one decarboxylase